MKKIAIDLTWVRHKKVGGTEAYIRNILDGIAEVSPVDTMFYLLVAKDNIDTFQEYREYSCFEFIECDVVAASQSKRILWQNFKMGALLRKRGIKVCFEPIYGKPFLGTRNVKFVTTIHDLQAAHFPEYFSKARIFWMKFSWWNAVRTSYKVIAISDFVREDILARYRVDADKIKTIHNIITVNKDRVADIADLQKYGVQPKQFYYTVSSLLPHKNLKTLILTMAELKRRQSTAFFPLVISGVGGKEQDSLQQLIDTNALKEDIIFTPFVDNAQRDLLYQQCRVFLFPSIFEGFGMPPIEAMAYDTPVITTRRASLPEVTRGLATYVEDPFSTAEWCKAIEQKPCAPDMEQVKAMLECYEKRHIVEQLLQVL